MNPREIRRRRAMNEVVDNVALEEFNAAHGAVELPPVAVVIAAYKEAESIGQVLEQTPGEICGLSAAVIVVIDGEDDGTAKIVRDRGQYAVIAPVNRGQGAALRLGYRVARDFGATYIVTADADGQSDPGDLGTCLAPVIAGEADFVNGSRRLGVTHSDDLVRNTGVVVFAAIISLLTGTKVTDTANPIRAMHASATAEVALDEQQFQASELLISMIMTGQRYGERPVTMRERQAGSSKKGGNLAYGYYYGRVVLRTFWREQRRARTPDLD